VVAASAAGRTACSIIIPIRITIDALADAVEKVGIPTSHSEKEPLSGLTKGNSPQSLTTGGAVSSQASHWGEIL